MSLWRHALRFHGFVGAIHKTFMPEERRNFGDAIWQRMHSVLFNSDAHFKEFADSGRLEDIQVMIVWGREDRIIDVTGVDTLKCLWPKWRVEVVEEAGHAVFVEKPKLV